MLGAHSQPRAGDENSQAIADQVKHAASGQLGHPFNQYRVVAYTSQVVAGMNYKLKIEIDQGEHIHLHVYVPLPHTNQPPSITHFERNKMVSDPL